MMIERIRAAVPTVYRRSKLLETTVVETEQSLTVLPDGKRRNDPGQQFKDDSADKDSAKNSPEDASEPPGLAVAPFSNESSIAAPSPTDLPHIDVVA